MGISKPLYEYNKHFTLKRILGVFEGSAVLWQRVMSWNEDYGSII